MIQFRDNHGRLRFILVDVFKRGHYRGFECDEAGKLIEPRKRWRVKSSKIVPLTNK